MKKNETVCSVEAVVTPFGGSGHVILPKTWIGKKVRVAVTNKISEGL